MFRAFLLEMLHLPALKKMCNHFGEDSALLTDSLKKLPAGDLRHHATKANEAINDLIRDFDDIPNAGRWGNLSSTNGYDLGMLDDVDDFRKSISRNNLHKITTHLQLAMNTVPDNSHPAGSAERLTTAIQSIDAVNFTTDSAQAIESSAVVFRNILNCLNDCSKIARKSARQASNAP